MSCQRRVEAIVAIVLLVGIVAFLAISFKCAQQCARKAECMNNLRWIGLYVELYVAKYGNGCWWPPANGYSYLETLRRVPDNERAVAHRDDKIFFCPVLRQRASPKRNVDYLQRVRWRRITKESSASEPQCSDFSTNHNVAGDDDIHVLLIDGSVIRATPGSEMWKHYMEGDLLGDCDDE